MRSVILRRKHPVRLFVEWFGYRVLNVADAVSRIAAMVFPRATKQARVLECYFLHETDHEYTPWGINHYSVRCHRCGRRWDEFE